MKVFIKTKTIFELDGKQVNDVWLPLWSQPLEDGRWTAVFSPSALALLFSSEFAAWMQHLLISTDCVHE